MFDGINTQILIKRFTEPKVDFLQKPVSTVWLISVIADIGRETRTSVLLIYIYLLIYFVCFCLLLLLVLLLLVVVVVCVRVCVCVCVCVCVWCHISHLIDLVHYKSVL